MNLTKVFAALGRAVLEEAGRNPDFRARLEQVLRPSQTEGAHGREIRAEPSQGDQFPSGNAAPSSDDAPARRTRKGGRRTPALFDPVEAVRDGEALLRQRLAGLDIERLRDVVAQFGMDPGKLVMKWKDPDRVIDRIVEVAIGRATKGDAFRQG